MRASSDRRYSRRTRVVGASTAAVVALGVGGALALNSSRASAELPAMSAQELLATMHEAERSPLTGTVAIEADLGLPDVRGLGNGNADPTALLAGTHTARVWLGGHAQSRVDLLGDAAETRVSLDGTDLWAWSSRTKEARHYILPKHDDMAGRHKAMHGSDMQGSDSKRASERAARAAGHKAMMEKHHGSATSAPATPQEAADRVLEAIGDTTAVTTENTTVAGRAAYSLVLRPKTAGTLVDRIELAVDGEKKLPLRVQVYSTKMSNPAYSVGFSKVDFSAPDASVFAFTPPSGATVTTTDVAAQMKERRAQRGQISDAEKAKAREKMQQRHDAAKGNDKNGDESRDKSGSNAVGEGWARVYVAAAPGKTGSDGKTGGSDGRDGGNAADALLNRLNSAESGAATSDTARTMTRLLEALPKRTVDGVSGTVFEGTLFTVVMADDGRVALGAVPADTVFSALAK